MKWRRPKTVLLYNKRYILIKSYNLKENTRLLPKQDYCNKQEWWTCFVNTHTHTEQRSQKVTPSRRRLPSCLTIVMWYKLGINLFQSSHYLSKRANRCIQSGRTACGGRAYFNFKTAWVTFQNADWTSETISLVQRNKPIPIYNVNFFFTDENIIEHLYY